MLMKGQCIPRMMKSNNYPKNKSSPASPMTLLERFREAVLRLMMLSALSKATADHDGSGGDSNQGQNKHCCYRLNEHHHSEAVADCIEFIKQKAAVRSTGQNHHSTANSSGGESTAEIVMPDYCNT
ncbi:hypothetical protein K1719_007169 [Acacia pycnantha]|nr:hypothetical protein K1719_007169 [Acacia pycnantha]